MKIRDLLGEKISCYATDKVQDCTEKDCQLYCTCISFQAQLEAGYIDNREDVLNNIVS